MRSGLKPQCNADKPNVAKVGRLQVRPMLAVAAVPGVYGPRVYKSVTAVFRLAAWVLSETARTLPEATANCQWRIRFDNNQRSVEQNTLLGKFRPSLIRQNEKWFVTELCATALRRIEARRQLIMRLNPAPEFLVVIQPKAAVAEFGRV